METGKISSKQMNALVFVSLLSPVIRLFPNLAVSVGGKGVWISPLVALPIVLLLTAMIKSFTKSCGEDEALGDAIIKAVGRVPGKAILVIILLWLIFYTGFIVKSSAERLLSSIYPNGQPGMFMVTLLAVAVWMAVGGLRGLGRTAEIFAFVIGAILLIITVAAGFKIEAANILPVKVTDIDNILLGALPVANVIGISAYMAFLKGEKEKAGKYKAVFAVTAVVAAVILTTLGSMGKELIGGLQHSFFVMIRDVQLAGVTDRIEAAVIITWVITDLIYVTVLLKVCGDIGSTVFKKEKRKINIIFFSIISLIIAFFATNNAFSMHFISGFVIPIVNILVVYLLLPLLFVVGRIRQKI